MRLEQIFGGNPVGVILRLVILSVVVGIILSALGITPDNILYRLSLLVGRIYDMGWGAVQWALGYFLLGAVIVIPIWLLSRLLGRGKRPDDRSR